MHRDWFSARGVTPSCYIPTNHERGFAPHSVAIITAFLGRRRIGSQILSVSGFILHAFFLCVVGISWHNWERYVGRYNIPNTGNTGEALLYIHTHRETGRYSQQQMVRSSWYWHNTLHLYYFIHLYRFLHLRIFFMLLSKNWYK